MRAAPPDKRKRARRAIVFTIGSTGWRLEPRWAPQASVLLRSTFQPSWLESPELQVQLRVPAAVGRETREARDGRPGLSKHSPVNRQFLALSESYIIPPMSGMAGAAAPSFSGGSATMHSVVRMFLAIDAAF